MTTLNLKVDYHPLCDRHHTEMMVASTMPHQTERTHRCCSEPDCTRHYDAFDGYYDVIRGSRLQGKFDNPILACRQDESRMYLASRNESTNIELWACPFCQQTQTVRCE